MLAGKISILLFIFIGIILVANTAYTYTEEADLVGLWYPDSEKELSQEITELLAKATPEGIPGKIIGIISPHAGLSYSGRIAAFSYKAAEKNRDNIHNIIIIGFNHRYQHPGIAVCNAEYYKTPLGKVKINQEISNKLTGYSTKIYPLKEAFENENSSEIEIPFLQKAFDNFKLTIIHIGDQKQKNCSLLIDALYMILKDKDDFLIIGSSDMSHYLSYQTARQIDAKTISLLKKFDPDLFYKESQSRQHRLMCGYGAIYTTLGLCKRLGAVKLKPLKYATSGDITKDKSKVVGYLSAVLYKENNQNKTKRSPEEADIMDLTKEDKITLINIARKTLQKYLSSEKIPQFKINSERLSRKNGAFVTLKKNGQLRGCIGNIIGQKPLYLTVSDMAIQAASNDPRFTPITLEELGDIEIEISVMSPLKKAGSSEDIVLGKHGVIVKQGLRSGVFLPQVANETGWSKEEFLSYLCAHKAGLDPDAWKDTTNTELYTFTASVFSEKELK